MNDTGRQKVYNAENAFAQLLDEGWLGVGQRRFGNLDGVRAYLDAVRRCSWGHGDIPLPTIRPRKGNRRAHYEPATNTIAIPDEAVGSRLNRWALSELVVLHEYAHAVAHHKSRATGHGQVFRDAYLGLVYGSLGDTAGDTLRDLFENYGLTETPKQPHSALSAE